MKNLGCLAFVLLIVIARVAAAQSPAALPKPTPPDDDVVKISTNLIQIDVTVVDQKGKPITDLKPGEIEIYENGEKQKITNFSYISTTKAITEKSNPVDKTGVPLPPVTLRPEQIRRTIALVIDDLSLSFDSAYQTRRALKKFVDEQMLEGDLVAIIRTGAGIGALQQFTSDKRMLYAAIEKVKWNPQGGGGISAFAPLEAAPETDDASDPEAEAATGSGQNVDDFRNSLFATGTLGALKYVVTGMGQLPGRKSVILFSNGFKLFETDDMGFQESGRVLDSLQQLVDLANRSSVVIYTVDARGLVSTALTAADAVSDASGEALSTAQMGRGAELTDTQEGLGYLADETGGFSIRNSNDLSGGVRRILDEQSYYLIAYEPDSDTFDPVKRKFNQLNVKVLRKGASVRYRSGFFNVAEKAPEKVAATLSPTAQLEHALVSPFAVGGINLRLNALFGSDEKNGAYVRSLLHINASDLQFTDEKGGLKKATFDVLAMSFGDNGQVIDQLAKGYSLLLKPDTYKKVLADGFVYHFMFPVKKAGAYQYRVAIRDTQAGKVGSASQFIEVPDLKKNRLTVSSIVIENMTADEWRRSTDPSAPAVSADPMSDTALRRIRINTVLRYGFEIYNAKPDGTGQPRLTTRIRVFRDGKSILDGKQTPFELRGQTTMNHLKSTGALAIGTKMVPGDYILQIIVTDSLAKGKNQIASQFVQFEVVE